MTAQVRVVRDGAAPAVLFEGPAPQRFTDAAWDLSAMGEQAVRIDLVARGGGMAWGEPRLMVPGSVPAAAAKRTFDHIYVWMIDTLRADKVRAYNPKTNVQTPNYDAFAADATMFRWAQVPGTWSLPSQASMLTGVYPSVHRATEHESKINPQLPIAPEILKKGGFRTALFSSNGYVSSKWGFARGFDMDKNFIRENLPNGADNLWATAKKWILAAKDKPQFVYLAVIEPHVIYNPKKEFLKLYWDKPYTGPIKPVMTGIQLGKIKQGKLKVNDTDKAYLEALHNAEITQSDTAFGVFLADLKAAGLCDTSAVIVISDHGDEFWDHGDCGHAQAPHQELVRVPFMIHAPGLLPEGQVIAADVEAMDLAPTLLELAGLPVPDSMQGQSVLGRGARRARALARRQHDPERDHGARDQVGPLPHDPLRSRAHRRSSTRSRTRASRSTWRASGRSPCARCATSSPCRPVSRTCGRSASGARRRIRARPSTRPTTSSESRYSQKP